MAQAELDRRLQVAELGAAVVAPPGKPQREHALVRAAAPRCASVSWISPPAPGVTCAEQLEDARRQDVAADHREGRGRVPGLGFSTMLWMRARSSCILSMVTMP